MLMFVDLITRLSQANVIIGIILCSIGLGIVLLSRKYVGSSRSGKEIQEDDRNILIARALGLIMIVVAMIVMIIY
ncbi:MAG: hypothetical protein IJA22_00585 [Clostridia bacterium]|nr:hypothetical protein [Clostridia bacterium]